MQAFIDGIGWGLVLCFLLGPIFFALIQAGIEQGFRAGMMVGLGIWFSDLLFISFIYFGISYVIQLTELRGFEQYLGVIGGILLIVFGLGTILSKRSKFRSKSGLVAHPRSYWSWWIKGFLINTANPFTFFFWIGIMTTVVANNGFSNHNALLFFIGIMGTIILTDSLKVGLAKGIRRWMKDHHVLWIRRVSGAALFVFGVALIIRVLW